MQQARRTAQQRRSQSGFTLVELMVIVVIVSVLALLGTYSVRKYVTASKTSEATEMITVIKGAEESYKDETFAYLNVSPTIDTWYPDNASPGRTKVQWGAVSAVGNNILPNWQALGVHAALPVLFQYSCVAGPSGAVPAPGGANSDITVGNWPATVSSPWYIVKAYADFEGNGLRTVFVGSSFYGEIFAAGN